MNKFEINNLVIYENNVYFVNEIFKNTYSLVSIDTGDSIAWIDDSKLMYHIYKNNSISLKGLFLVYKLQKIKEKIYKEIKKKTVVF